MSPSHASEDSPNRVAYHFRLKLGVGLLVVGAILVAQGMILTATAVVAITMGLLLAAVDVLEVARLWPRPSHRCEAPRAPRLSLILSHHLAQSLTLDAAWVFVLATTLLADYIARHPPWPYWLLVLAGCVVASRYLLANSTIRLEKYVLSWNRRIILFRRFDAQGAKLHRQRIAPIFGSYGMLTVIRDSTIDAAGFGPNADSENELIEVDRWLSYEDDGWRCRVKEELAVVDLAVFHWGGTPTENMEWEFERARERIPLPRLFFVCPEEAAGEVRAWLGARGVAGQVVMLLIAESKSYRQLAREAYVALRDLAPVPRLSPPETAASSQDPRPFESERNAPQL